MKKFINLSMIIGLVFTLTFIGCEDRSDLTAPSAPSTGSADFTKLVSIGNSLTAGYQNSSLYQSGQENSFAKLIADQVGTSFAVPYISEPGIPARLYVNSLYDAQGNLSPDIKSKEGLGSPLNLDYAAPYNNLGIPGAIIYDVIDETDFAAKSTARANPYFQIVLRNQALGASILKQAINLQPTLLTLWIGNNDVLGYATSGGTRGTDITGTLPTDVNVFNTLYTQIIGGLLQANPNLKIATANIPNIKAIPFFTTVGARVAQAITAAQAANPQVQGLVYFMGDNVTFNVATPADLASYKVLLTLVSSPAAAKIGQPFNWYETVGASVPPNVDVNFPFGVTPQNPWPNAYILDQVEIGNVETATTAFNQTIANTVAANPNNMVLVNIFSEFNVIASKSGPSGEGYVTQGVRVKADFISGGLFSLDGVHPTNLGHGIVANMFINAINAKWGASIPEVSIASLSGGVPLSKSVQYNAINNIKFPSNFLENLYF